VEAKASKTYDQIADEADEKDGVVAISDAAGNSFVCQVYEGEIGERIDDLSAVYASVIVL
jgi:hypothetical protein